MKAFILIVLILDMIFNFVLRLAVFLCAILTITFVSSMLLDLIRLGFESVSIWRAEVLSE